VYASELWLFDGRMSDIRKYYVNSKFWTVILQSQIVHGSESLIACAWFCNPNWMIYWKKNKILIYLINIFNFFFVTGQPVMLNPWIDCAGPCMSHKSCNFNCHNLGYKNGGSCSTFKCCCFRTWSTVLLFNSQLLFLNLISTAFQLLFLNLDPHCSILSCFSVLLFQT